MKINKSETTVNDGAWVTVIQAGKHVAEAYANLVKASDFLAEVMAYDNDYVLRKVLPSSVADRRNSKRIVEWLDGRRDELEKHLQEVNTRIQAALERDRLLQKLNLSAEEMELLGIKD